MIAGVIGAAGYAGAELVRLLSSHKEIKGLSLGSVSMEGERIENVYPNFFRKVSSPLLKPEEVIAASDIVFSALPHAVGEPYVKACIDKGIPCIDLSADFRFGEDEAAYKAWYGKPYEHPELRQRSIYGLPELNREQIRSLAASGGAVIANPGCYPTGASLGILPALAKGLVSGTVIVNAVTGITGGGREPQRAFHFPECSDSVSPYKVGCHRHQPEISRTLSQIAGRFKQAAPSLIFTPHLAPMNRGILSTIYIPLGKAGAELSEIHKLYADFYRDEPFVRLLPLGGFVSTGRVRQSNFCDISLHLDGEGTTLIAASAIDNMLKGASGQALQNMNILFGFDETEGLDATPALF
ncbi:MAG: N-acetyl-gamma-glutamyl-phosphate reductase [Treponema sp.]|nr:N-acetyl-gamma-glutamyl-phosphate reductase [Treponema sp.]